MRIYGIGAKFYGGILQSTVIFFCSYSLPPQTLRFGRSRFPPGRPSSVMRRISEMRMKFFHCHLSSVICHQTCILLYCVCGVCHHRQHLHRLGQNGRHCRQFSRKFSWLFLPKLLTESISCAILSLDKAGASASLSFSLDEESEVGELTSLLFSLDEGREADDLVSAFSDEV